MSSQLRRVVTSAEAARLLGVSVSTAQQWITRGVLPSWRTPGGHRRLHVGDVLDLAAKLKSSGRQLEPLPLEFLPLQASGIPVPSFEAERLAAVHEAKIIDTPPAEAFDRLTALATHVCDCPMALVTLLTSTRQWFKSRVGFGLSQTPRDAAFCSYAILEPAPLIVEDAMNDSRFSSNPLVLGEPRIRFYAGFPVFGQDNLPFGTLCVLDREPRRLRQREMKSMEYLATIVSEELVRRSHKLSITSHSVSQNRNGAGTKQVPRFASGVTSILSR
jgi:excisionase family DNA binding protein